MVGDFSVVDFSVGDFSEITAAHCRCLLRNHRTFLVHSKQNARQRPSHKSMTLMAAPLKS